MSHTKIIDGQTVTSGGGTQSGTHEVGRSDVNIRVFVDGDSNSTNIDLEFYSQPEDSSSWFFVDGTEKKGVDITTGEQGDNSRVFTPDFRPAEKIKVIVKNNAASDTTVTVLIKQYTT